MQGRSAFATLLLAPSLLCIGAESHGDRRHGRDRKRSGFTPGEFTGSLEAASGADGSEADGDAVMGVCRLQQYLHDCSCSCCNGPGCASQPAFLVVEILQHTGWQLPKLRARAATRAALAVRQKLHTAYEYMCNAYGGLCHVMNSSTWRKSMREQRSLLYRCVVATVQSLARIPASCALHMLQESWTKTACDTAQLLRSSITCQVHWGGVEHLAVLGHAFLALVQSRSLFQRQALHTAHHCRHPARLQPRSLHHARMATPQLQHRIRRAAPLSHYRSSGGRATSGTLAAAQTRSLNSRWRTSSSSVRCLTSTVRRGKAPAASASPISCGAGGSSLTMTWCAPLLCAHRGPAAAAEVTRDVHVHIPAQPAESATLRAA